MAISSSDLDRIASQIKVKTAKPVSPVTPAQPAQNTLGFFKDLFVGGDETAGGVVRNTIKGIPAAAGKLGADILRAVPREGASFAASLPGQRDLPVPVGDTPAAKAQRFIFGEEPIQGVQSRTKGTESALQSFGVGEKTSKVLAPIGVASTIALDLFPGTSGKSAVVKQLIKDTTEEAAIKTLQKSVKNISAAKAREIAPLLAKAGTKKEVESILSTALKSDVKASEAIKAGAQATAVPPFKVPAVPTTPIESAVAKLVDAVTKAQTRTPEIAAQRTEELGKRLGEGAKEFAKGGGEQAIGRVLSKLKGPLVEKRIFNPVRDQLSTNEVKTIFDKINFAADRSTTEKITLTDGLRKILEGELPEPKQLEDLEDFFGHDLVKALQKHTKGNVIYDNVIDALNIPRSFMTTADMSAPFRQGLLAGFLRPGKVPGAFKEMVRQAFSKKEFEGWLDTLKASPDYRVMKRAGLYISDPRDLAGGLGGREEAFMSRLIEKVPVLKDILGGSQRAYLGYLNKLRADIFMDMAKTFGEQGANSAADIKSLAELVNVATGRGNLGKLARNAPLLNAAMFSPRLIASRLSLMNPRWYLRQTPAVRKEAVKMMVKFVGTGMSILALAKLAGADVEDDPRSTDFGKIKVGNTRWDIWGGFQQYIRVFSQLVKGQRKTTGGEIQNLSKKEFPFTTRKDVAQSFVEGKLAPVPSLFVQLAQGQSPIGEDLSAGETAYNNLVPLYLQDLGAAYEEGGLPRAVGTGVPGFFGVGTATYAPKSSSSKKKSGLNITTKKGTTAAKKVKVKLGN